MEWLVNLKDLRIPGSDGEREGTELGRRCGIFKNLYTKTLSESN